MIKISGKSEQTNTDNEFSNFDISFFIEKRTSSEWKWVEQLRK